MGGPSALRRLWQPLARFDDRPSDRRVTFLELFFDLVFVVVISQFAHRLVILWFRTGLHDPSHRAASIPYSLANLVAGALFAASAPAGDPGRYWLWAIGLAIQVVGIVVAFRR